MAFSLAEMSRRGAHAVWDTIQIVLGCILMAVAFGMFLNANEIVPGGVVGLSTILQGAFHWEPAVVQWTLNLPLLAIGFWGLGRAEGMRSALGSVVLPLSILAFRNVQPITHAPLLAAVFGGVTYGVGLGLILLAHGSVGGYSLFARVVAKRLHVSVATVIFCLDAVTITAGGFEFGAEKVMYGLIAAYAMRRTIEAVILGFSKSFMALIISPENDQIRQTVLRDMDRGVTVLHGSGGYTGVDRPVLMIVVGQLEVPRLRTVVRQCDPDAFVVLTDATEVLGRGFHNA